jgi:hypothetical protein
MSERARTSSTKSREPPIIENLSRGAGAAIEQAHAAQEMVRELEGATPALGAHPDPLDPLAEALGIALRRPFEARAQPLGAITHVDADHLDEHAEGVVVELDVDVDDVRLHRAPLAADDAGAIAGTCF